MKKTEYTASRSAAGFALLLLLLVLLPGLPRAEEPPAGDDRGASESEAEPRGATRYSVGADVDFVYRKPGLFDVLKNIPEDFAEFSERAFRRENTWKILGLVSSTALLVAYDQDINDAAQRLGRKLNISTKDKTRTLLSAGGRDVFRGPTDLGSAFYYLGDGWTHFSIGGGFLAYGLLADDNRGLQTGSQLVEAILVTGISTQVLKHLTGRESPSVASAPGGKWRVFPNQFDYYKHVSRYDAYPSGHLATAMATVTVIAENYPDYPYIRPVGYTLMTLLSFQMLNSSVHWASDYPLALVLGYSFGKIAADRGKTAEKRGEADRAHAEKGLLDGLRILPAPLGDGGVGVSLWKQF